MKKINIPKKLTIAIITILIVLFTSIYTITTADYVVSQNVLIAALAGICVFTVLSILLAIKIYNAKQLKPEKMLLVISILFCILFLVLVPVGRGHDEVMHWLKAFSISQGDLLPYIDEDNKLAVVIVPDNIREIVIERQKGVFKYVDNIQLLDQKLNTESYIATENQNAAAYCFVQYLPEVIGIIIGKLFTQIPLLIAYFARIINIIFCITIMYFAIKIIPFAKNILLVLSIIPITIEGFSTISPDGITIALCALFIAYTLYVTFDDRKKCGTRETVILTIIGAIVALCKIVYLPLLGLVLIIPKEKFANKKDRILSLSIIIGVGTICNLLWLIVGSSMLLQTNTNTYLGTQEDGTMIKIMSLIQNPIQYIQKIFYTIGEKGNEYFLGLFGGYLEWSESVKIEIVPYVACAISVIAAISETKLKDAFTKFQKIIIVLVIVVITILIFTSLYIQWTDNSLLYIDGVQGRYFLPILPLILMLLGTLKSRTNITNTGVTKLIGIVGLIIIIYTVTQILAEHL